MNFTSCLLLWAFREIPVFTASTVLPWHRHLVLTPQDPSQPHPQDDLPEVGFLRPRAYPFFSKERALRKDWSTYPPTGSVWGLWVKCCLWKKNKQTKKTKKTGYVYWASLDFWKLLFSESSSNFTQSCGHLFPHRRWGTKVSDPSSSLEHFQCEFLRLREMRPDDWGKLFFRLWVWCYWKTSPGSDAPFLLQN